MLKSILLKFQIDFASRDCQTAFFEKMGRTGQLRPGERPDERMGRLYQKQTSFEQFEEHNSFEGTTRYDIH